MVSNICLIIHVNTDINYGFKVPVLILSNFPYLRHLKIENISQEFKIYSAVRNDVFVYKGIFSYNFTGIICVICIEVLTFMYSLII